MLHALTLSHPAASPLFSALAVVLSGFPRLLRSPADASAAQAQPPEDPREAALVQALKRGEADAYETLVREHGGRMLSVARRYLRTEEEARDAVQEAFISAFRAIGRFAEGARLSTWLHRIVVNAALMRIRARKSRPEESIEEFLPTFAEDGHHARPVAAWSVSSHEVLERTELRTAVRAAIDRLPDNYRTVLLLRDIEELDTAEAAAALGISENAVKVRLHRARQALRSLLEPLMTQPNAGNRGREERHR